MERLTMESDKGGVALNFDLDVTCEKSEMLKILKMPEKLKEYEDLEEQCTKENFLSLKALFKKWKEFFEDIQELYDSWFESGCNVFPKDKMLCVCIHRYGDQTPRIYQYRKADFLHEKSDYFLDVSEKWELYSFDCPEWNPSFATMLCIATFGNAIDNIFYLFIFKSTQLGKSLKR